MPNRDEVGNPRGINPFTGVNIMEYYTEICKSENCECVMDDREWKNRKYPILDCRPHSKQFPKPTKMTYWHIDEICSNVSPDWGLLGTKKDTEEKLMLFPSIETSNKVCKIIKKNIRKYADETRKYAKENPDEGKRLQEQAERIEKASDDFEKETRKVKRLTDSMPDDVFLKPKDMTLDEIAEGLLDSKEFAKNLDDYVKNGIRGKNTKSVGQFLTEEIRKLRKTGKPTLEGKQELLSIIKKIDSNINQINTNAAKLNSWLEDHKEEQHQCDTRNDIRIEHRYIVECHQHVLLFRLHSCHAEHCQSPYNCSNKRSKYSYRKCIDYRSHHESALEELLIPVKAESRPHRH